MKIKLLLCLSIVALTFTSFAKNPKEKKIEAIDLGLSVKWASCNVGATKPEDYGGYYQWAGTTDVTSTSITLDWSNCPYHTSSDQYTGWTKYNFCIDDGTVDKKMTLDLSDDAANVNWGGSWRMPTDAEWYELINNCTRTWTTINSINGYKVTSRKSGYKDKYIFLPAVGYRDDDRLYNRGSIGYYWSSSLSSDLPNGAWFVGIHSNETFTYGGNCRYLGLSVRPVCE